MTDERPPAPTITSAEYDAESAPSAVHVSGTSEVAGTITLYDGEAPVSTTSTVEEGDRLTFSFTVTDQRFVSPGEHPYSCCVTTGAANPEDGTVTTSEWSAVVTVTIGG